MDRDLVVLLELLLILGLVFGFGIWELRSLRRQRRQDERAEHEDRHPHD